MADLQSTNQRQRIKKSSAFSSKNIQKKTGNFTNLAKQIVQDGQVWEEIEETPSSKIFVSKNWKIMVLDLGKQTREYDPNKARIRRIQKQNQINGVDMIGF